MTATGQLSLRLALIVALAATLGLTACGRKGPLDPPPAATASPTAGTAGTASGTTGTASDTAGTASDSDAGASGAAGEDPAARSQAPKKRIPLDVLLN